MTTCRETSWAGKIAELTSTRFGPEVSRTWPLYVMLANIRLVTGHTADELPHIGAVPNKPSQFLIAGFNGHGMPVIHLASKGVAAMVRDGKSFEETGIPRIFKTTEDRLSDKFSS